MAHTVRFVLESPQILGVGETGQWEVDVSPWGTGPPTNLDTKLFKKDADVLTDVTDAHVAGATTNPSGNIVRTAIVGVGGGASLVAEENYYLYIYFSIDGKDLSCILQLYCTE